ncbi:hypothetical protein C8046_14535 [Serinibacter arcticus]|uniref:DUF7507 domain-containing protein n=1 Tax=Serinibacter arcticus TaxID=1655435 RepID=A0A2U1ZXN2_9MICO|nr:hypothetical protein [Serinibacter arcticus]PWD51682.1 hypothetical protein C8046_14535 [Serinibacter arcticus]
MNVLNRWTARVVPLVLVLAGAVAGVVATAPAAEAAVVRPFTLNYNQAVYGDLIHVGNGSSVCPGASAPTDPFGTAKSECATAQARTNTQATGINDSFYMQWADVDASAATYNSSQATVTIPTGATVAFARLAWSGDTGTIRLADGTVSALPGCNTRQFLAGAGTSVLPAGTPESTSVRLTVGANPTTTVAPRVISRDALASVPASQPQFYAAHADVTTQLGAAPTGTPTTVTVGNVWSPQGFGCYSGWSLSVVYSYPTANVNAPTARQVQIWDGHVRQSSIDPATTVTASGFTANATGARVAVTAFEGDFNITGDRFAINGTNVAEPQTGATTNFFNSATDGAAAPAVANNMSVDAKSLPAAVAVGATSLPLTFSTSGDTFLATTIGLSVPVAPPPTPALDVALSSPVSTYSSAGQSVVSTALVTNTGNVALSDVTTVMSAGATPVAVLTCPHGTLQPDAQVTCQATATVSQADLDTGSLQLSAVATGSSASGVTTSPRRTISLSAVQAPSLALIVTPSPVVATAAGQLITYTSVITNTGNVTLTGATVVPVGFSGSGPRPAASCPVEPLAPTASLTCTATYTLTQADVDAGGVQAFDLARAAGPNGAPVSAPIAPSRVDVAPTGSLTTDVTLSPSVATTAGAPITISFAVTNTGNVTLGGVTPRIDAFGGTGAVPAISCPAAAGSLAPSSSVTCTASYSLTQDDVDDGGIDVVGSGVASTPAGVPVTSAADSGSVTVAAAPSVSSAVSVDPTVVEAAGTTVTFAVDITNTGNVTLTDVAPSDVVVTGTGTPLALSCPAAAESVAPTESVTCEATYTITQADVDAGSVTATVVSRGTAPSGTSVLSPASSATVTSPPAAALAIGATATPTAAALAGEEVTFDLVLTNTGNVTLTGATAVAATFTGSDPLGAITCEPGAASLAPTAEAACSATYTLTQADVDAGGVSLTATGRATAGGAAVETTPATAVVTVAAAPAIGLAVTATPTVADGAEEEVSFSLVLTNTGNVTLTGATAAVDTFTGSGAAPTITCPAGATLAPQAEVACTAGYVLTQADADAGGVSLTATASGTPSGGEAVGSGPESVAVVVTAAPALTLTATATPATIAAAGEPVTFAFTVSNAGNVTLTDVDLTPGAFTGGGDLSAVACPAAASSLAPGDEVTCTTTTTSTQADLDAGGLAAGATATGTPPSGEAISSTGATAAVAADARPAIEVAASATPAEPESFAVGQEISYELVVTNTGNVTLAGTSAIAATFSGSDALSAITCPADVTVAPDAAVTCTATYTITQADVDARELTLEVVASATAPSGSGVLSDPVRVTLSSVPRPALALVTTADRTTIDAAGQEVGYTFVAENTGTLTLTGLELAGTAFSGTGATPEIVCPTDSGPLAPGAEVTCTADYVVTQADVDSGALTHSAVATATPSGGILVVLAAVLRAPGDVSSEASTLEILSERAPALTVQVSSSGVVTAAGDVVTATAVVANAGNVTLTDVGALITVEGGSGAVSPIVCGEGAASLAPGAEVTCTVTYTAAEGDLSLDGLVLEAVGVGTAPDGEPLAVRSLPVTAAIAVDPVEEATTPPPTTEPPTTPGPTSPGPTTPGPTTPGVPPTAGPGRPMAETGADLRVPAGIALSALLLGAGAVLTARRRRA